MADIKEVITFVDFLSDFTNVKRGTKIKGKGDVENDAEHSYQVALVAWYLADVLKLDVNRQLVLEYALAHDLVEAYAGDTDIFSANAKEELKSKPEREEKAKHRIRENFPAFVSLHKCIDDYEHLNNDESRLVYIVDKLLPDINIYLSGDTYYQDKKVIYAEWEKWFRSKVEKSGMRDEKLLALVDQLIEFQKGREIFFGN